MPKYMLYMLRKACTLMWLYSFFGNVKYKPLLVVVFWPDSGCIQNVSTNFYFPDLSPRLVGPEKFV